MAATSFASEFRIYVGRVREFDRHDWRVYVAWVGLMVGLTATLLGFVLVGRCSGWRAPCSAEAQPGW